MTPSQDNGDNSRRRSQQRRSLNETPETLCSWQCTRCGGQLSLKVTPDGPVIIVPSACPTKSNCELEALRDYYAKLR
jgi:hypothetical protein